MGSDPAPFTANIFLPYENKWLLETKKNNLCNARFFSNKCLFIENLCAINDYLEFDRNSKIFLYIPI